MLFKFSINLDEFDSSLKKYQQVYRFNGRQQMVSKLDQWKIPPPKLQKFVT